MMTDDTNKAGWFLEAIGLEIEARSGNELICMCPWCMKENHFYLNSRSLLYDCKVCGEQGNYQKLLAFFASELADTFTGDPRLRLAQNRKLPPEAFDGYGFGWTGDFYTLPIFVSSGHLTDLRRYQPGGKLLSAPGCWTGLFQSHLLLDPQRRDEPVFVTEGEWDAIALEWLRRKAGAKGIVVGVPGANTFKHWWVNLLSRRRVFVAYDNDEAGAQGERRVATMLANIAESITFFQWRSDDATGKDLRDLIGGIR